MIIYLILQFINVVLGTLKTLTMTKSSKHIGAIVNTLSFTFYAAVIKQMGSQDLWFVLVVTAITNFIGFYVADFLFNKAQKDKLWRISVTFTSKNNQFSGYAKVIKVLKEYNISYTMVENNQCRIVDIYSENQLNSKIIKEVLNSTECQYHVIEISKAL